MPAESGLDSGAAFGSPSTASGSIGGKFLGAVGQEMLGMFLQPTVGQQGAEGRELILFERREG